MRQIDAGRAVERLFQIDDHGLAAALFIRRDQEVAGVGVGQDQGHRLPPFPGLHGLGEAFGPGEFGFDLPCRLGAQPGGGQVAGLLADLHRVHVHGGWKNGNG